MRRLIALTLSIGTLGAAPALAHNEGIPAAPLDNSAMEHVNNSPNLSGNSMAPFERKLADGTVKRYLVSAVQGNGFDIVEVTDPTHPVVRGRYLADTSQPGQGTVTNSSAGVNFHPWVDVNPRRNIVALSIENPQGVAVRHNGSTGMIFVDISDVTAPKPLGKINGLDGPHTLRMIGNNHVYTSLNTYIVDYTDPMNPTAVRRNDLEAHEFYEDPNFPGRTYMGSIEAGTWKILNTSNPASPTVIATARVPASSLDAPHEVYPSPDSTYVGVADFKSGQTNFTCPGGGIHFFDISGKYVPGASLTNPRRMGTYFAPFSGLRQPSDNTPNHASCTTHSWHMQAERELALSGLYVGGTYVIDPSTVTQPGSGEYNGAFGSTTWGKTLGRNRDAADYVNATQWLPFDYSNPEDERYVFVNGWARGLDVYKFTGTMPKKLSRLRVDGSAAGGTVTGKLDRYAVLTHTGWANKPLAFRELQISAGGNTVTATTGADGSFSADLGLAAGTHQVTVTFAGDSVFVENMVTRAITA